MGSRLLPDEGLEFVPDDVFPSISRYIVNENDLIISIVGTVGNVSFIDARFENASLTENAAKLTGLDRSDAIYLYYFLSSRKGQEEIRKGTVGAVQAKLPLYSIQKIPVIWPPRPVRESISRVLGALDDKIELSRRMSGTLLEVAKTLFKSWFVDFDLVHAKKDGRIPSGADEMTIALFPDQFVDSEKGEIPLGWRYCEAQELVNIGIGKTPPRKELEWFSEIVTDVPWVSIRDMGISGVFMQSTSELLTEDAVSRFNVRVVPRNTVLLSFKLTVGRVSISDMPLATNEAIAHFNIFPEGPLSAEFLYLYLSQFNYDSLGSTSSIATAVNSVTIRQMPVIAPPKSIVDIFTEKVAPLFEKIRSNQSESRLLREMRESLLPMLLSGEVQTPTQLD
jgi:type I restriction enzyme S subunit